LFISIRIAASVCHDRQVRAGPWGAAILRLLSRRDAVVIEDLFFLFRHCERSEAIQNLLQRPWIASLRSQ
jgi:hypothetical protein